MMFSQHCAQASASLSYITSSQDARTYPVPNDDAYMCQHIVSYMALA